MYCYGEHATPGFSTIENGIEWQSLENNCYNFIDTNTEAEGVYSAMWVQGWLAIFRAPW